MTEKEKRRKEWVLLGRLELQTATQEEWDRYQDLTRKVIADMKESQNEND